MVKTNVTMFSNALDTARLHLKQKLHFPSFLLQYGAKALFELPQTRT